MITEIVFAGFGGQGVLTAGLVVSEMALNAGKKVIWMPAYGPAMRGGKAHSVVKFGDEFLGSPNMEEIDVLAAMNKPALEYMELVKKDGFVFANSDMIEDDCEVKGGINFIRIPCVTLAKELKNLKAANLVMVGAIIKRCGYFEKEFSLDAMGQYFKAKGKEKFNRANEAAFLAGYNAL